MNRIRGVYLRRGTCECSPALWEGLEEAPEVNEEAFKLALKVVEAFSLMKASQVWLARSHHHAHSKQHLWQRSFSLCGCESRMSK